MVARSCKSIALLAFVSGILGMPVAAQPPCVSVERAIDGCATPGGEVAVTVTISSTCGNSITALGLRETLPPGWRFQGVSSSSAAPPALTSNAGALGTAEFAWVDVPTFPATFRYTLLVSGAETAERSLSGAPIYRESGGEIAGTPVSTDICFSAGGEGEGEGEGETMGPVINLNGETSVTIECGSIYIDGGATASSPLDGDLTAAIVRSGFLDTRAAGDYILIYNVADSEGVQAPRVVRQVIVVDSTPPSITLTGAATITQACGMPYIEFGALATDVCDGTLPVFITGAVNIHELGDYTLTYTATDASGQSATATRLVQVRDTDGPQITLIGESPMFVTCNSPYEEPGAVAVDACDGMDAEVTIEIHIIDTSVPGMYTVRYRASDAAGIESAATRQVIVADTEAPAITLLGENPLFLDCDDVFIDPNAFAVDACDGDVIVSSDAFSLVDTSRPNTVEVTYSARDSRGNAAFEARTVIVGGPVCGGGPLFCDLADFAVTQPAVIGGMATVVIPEGDSARPLLLTSAVALESFQECETGTVRVTYEVAGFSQFSQDAETGFPAVYFLRAGEHTVRATAEVLENGDRLEREFTLNLITAPDADGNGFADTPFDALVADGDSWTSDTRFAGTDSRVAMATWFGPCDGAGVEPLTLRVRNAEKPSQVLTVEVDRRLLACGEQGILAVAMGKRLETILGESGAAGVPAPPAGVPSDAVYFDISIVISSDGGATFAPVSAAQLGDRPVRIALSGLDIEDPDIAGFVHFPTVVSGGAGGSFGLSAGTGSWTGSGLLNVMAAGSTLEGEATGLSLFTAVTETVAVEKEGGASCAPGTGTGFGGPLTDLLVMAIALTALLAFRTRRVSQV